MPKKIKKTDDLPCGPKCGDCPYRTESRGHIEPQLKPEALYALLGTTASYWDIIENTPFSGLMGGALQAKLSLANISRLDISLLNAVRCRPVKYQSCEVCGGEGHLQVGSTVTEYEYGTIEEPHFENCSECLGEGWIPARSLDGDYKDMDPEPGQIIECMKRYGHDDLQTLTKQRLIIAAGTAALFALTGRDNIGDYRGSVIDTIHGRALVTYHPEYLARGSQHLDPAVRRDFARIPSIVSETEGLGLELNYQKEPTADCIRQLKSRRSIVMDLETTGGLDPLKGGDILMAGVSRRPGEGIILSTGKDLAELLDGLDEIVGQNFGSYDAWWLHHRGYTVPQTIIDTKVLAHLANPATPNNLYFIQSEYADPPMPGYWKEREDYASDLEQVCIFDCDATARSELGLVTHLKREGQWGLAESVIIPWTRLAHELRVQGVHTDVGRLHASAEQLARDVIEGGRALSESSGCPLPKKTKTGIPSPRAIAKHLYETLGLPAQRHPVTRKVTADEPRLRRLYRWCMRNGRQDGVDFISALIGKPPVDGPEWTLALKRQSTMVKDMRKFAKRGMDEDGNIAEAKIYIHAEPKITGTETGRLSYELLHQVPAHCKSAFLPDPGHLLLQFDYKQIELLVMLYVAKEWELLGRCINDGLDFHTMTAGDFYNKPYETIEKDRRDLRAAIKPVSLGRIFGKGVRSTAIDMEMTENAVSAIFDRYNEIMPGLSRFQKEEVDRVQRKGYVHTEFGWRRWFTQEEQKYANRSSNATEIYNTRIQSNAGLRTRQALVEIWRALKADYGEGVGNQARLILTVHDSGLFSVHPDVIQRVAGIITEIATGPTHALPAPQLGMVDGLRFPIDLEVGENWGKMKPWEEYISGDLSLEPQSLTLIDPK